MTELLYDMSLEDLIFGIVCIGYYEDGRAVPFEGLR